MLAPTDLHRRSTGRSEAASCRKSGGPKGPPLHLVVPAASVADAGTHVAALRGIADRVLLLLVEEICGTSVERDAVANSVAAGQIEAGVSGVVEDTRTDANRPGGSVELCAKKIAVGAHSGEIAAECDAEAAIGGIQGERTGVHGAPQEVVARRFRHVKGIGRLEYPAVVVGVISGSIQPAGEPRYSFEIESASAGTVGVEIVAEG